METRTGDGDAAAGHRLSRRRLLSGAAGALAIGAAGTAAAQSTGASGGGNSVEVDLVDYAFVPGTKNGLVIPPGTEVTFVWKTGGHNIHVDQQPDGADWQGHATVEDAGFSVSHTFQTPGHYHFWCVPHKSLGMVGDIQVKEGASIHTASSGGSGFTFPAGDLGISFMGVLLGTAGVAAALVLVGELTRTVKGDAEGPTSARTTALAAIGVGLVLLLAVVFNLVLT